MECIIKFYKYFDLVPMSLYTVTFHPNHKFEYIIGTPQSKVMEPKYQMEYKNFCIFMPSLCYIHVDKLFLLAEHKLLFHCGWSTREYRHTVNSIEHTNRIRGLNKIKKKVANR